MRKEMPLPTIGNRPRTPLLCKGTLAAAGLLVGLGVVPGCDATPRDNQATRTGPAIVLVPVAKNVPAATLDQARDVIRRRLEQMGVKSSSVRRTGSQIEVQLGDGSTRSRAEIAKALIKRGLIHIVPLSEDQQQMTAVAATLQRAKSTQATPVRAKHETWNDPQGNQRKAVVLEGPNRATLEHEIRRALTDETLSEKLTGKDFVYRESDNGKWRAYLVNFEAGMSLTSLRDVRLEEPSQDSPRGYKLVLHPPDAKRFTQLTSRNVGNRVFLIFDHELTIAPVVKERIEGPDLWLSFKPGTSAPVLAQVLAAGALPVELAVLPER
jgi:preprotein translocase subunit SecD